MKTIILAIILFIFISSISFADEYILVMSKDDNVCKHILKLYNDDFKKYGAVKYDQHDEFNAIKWERKRVYKINEKGEKDYYYSVKETMLLSNFDINNDGKEEIVIKSYESGLHAIPSDQIYIFNKSDVAQFSDSIQLNQELYKRELGFVGYSYNTSPFRNNGYELKEIPPAEIAQQLGNERSVPIYHFLGGWFFFNPFIYDKVYYIAMTDWFPQQVETKKWLVILKLDPGDKIKDTCYFRKKTTKPLKKK